KPASKKGREKPELRCPTRVVNRGVGRGTDVGCEGLNLLERPGLGRVRQGDRANRTPRGRKRLLRFALDQERQNAVTPLHLAESLNLAVHPPRTGGSRRADHDEEPGAVER